MNNLNYKEIYFLVKGAEDLIKVREDHIVESKQNLKTAINCNDAEWQEVIVGNIQYDTNTICILKSAIEKLKAI